MLKLYYTLDKVNSHEFLFSVLSRFHGVLDTNLLRSKNGKPYLSKSPVHFSLSHSEKVTAVAVYSSPVGLDVEYTQKSVDYSAILRRLTPLERAEITGMPPFFYHWTAKESYVKFLGERLLKYYQKLAFIGGRLLLESTPLPLAVLQGELTDGYVYSITVDNPTAVEVIKV